MTLRPEQHEERDQVRVHSVAQREDVEDGYPRYGDVAKRDDAECAASRTEELAFAVTENGGVARECGAIVRVVRRAMGIRAIKEDTVVVLLNADAAPFGERAPVRCEEHSPASAIVGSAGVPARL